MSRMSAAPVAASPRISWTGLPDAVRADIEAALGGAVVAAQSQVGGFSPGSADRVVLDDGRRAFVKAAGLSLNPDTPGLHRAEITAMGWLPAGAPAPRLLHAYDDGDWVALVLEDVPGRHMSVPYVEPEVVRLRETLDAAAPLLTPCPPEARSFVETHEDLFDGWRELARSPAEDLDPWAHRRLSLLVELEQAAQISCEGSTLVHGDIRADNVLLTPDGGVFLVDWAWASRGASWLDVLLVALALATQGGPDPEAFLAADPLLRATPGADIDAFLVAAAGMWARNGRRPPPPGLPGIRTWQLHCEQATLRWLERRGL
jgi:aminoglycoside phosphotransferase